MDTDVLKDKTKENLRSLYNSPQKQQAKPTTTVVLTGIHPHKIVHCNTLHYISSLPRLLYILLRFIHRPTHKHVHRDTTLSKLGELMMFATDVCTFFHRVVHSLDQFEMSYDRPGVVVGGVKEWKTCWRYRTTVPLGVRLTVLTRRGIAVTRETIRSLDGRYSFVER